MRTDLNFAKYGYQPGSGRLVLLDFGAARPVPPETSAGYRGLLEAGLSGDRGRHPDRGMTNATARCWIACST